jgi:hypothetical protein
MIEFNMYLGLHHIVLCNRDPNNQQFLFIDIYEQVKTFATITFHHNSASRDARMTICRCHPHLRLVVMKLKEMEW